MAATTPDWKGEAALQPLASRYVDMEELPWRKTPFPGIEVKMLMEDTETGMMTSLTRMAPGSVLPPHEHVGVEQTYVLEGHLVDDEGEVRAGQYVWRPAGSVHTARAPEGALLLGMFMKPNRFL